MGIPLKPGQQEVVLNPGQSNVPQVSMIIDKNKNYAPKQNLNRPEKSIQLMQQKGLGGQRPPNSLKK